MMILTAEREGEILELGRGFTIDTAYDYLLEADSDFDKPILPEFDLILTDGENRFILDGGCWCPL